MYVNEEGLRRGLEFNPRATLLWWFFVPRARNKAMLVGHAVVVGLPNRDGASTSIPAPMQALLLHEGRFAVEVLVDNDDRWQRQAVMPQTVTDAMVWAMLFIERVDYVRDVRVVPV